MINPEGIGPRFRGSTWYKDLTMANNFSQRISYIFHINKGNKGRKSGIKMFKTRSNLLEKVIFMASKTSGTDE